MNIFYRKFGRRGFTLIELIVVIAVLAIVVTMAVPRYLNQVRDARFVKACSDAKVVSDAILQKIAMAGGAAPIDESTSYAADQVAGAIGDSLYDSTGRSVAGIPAGTYYPIDEAEIQNLISEDVDLSNMVMDQDGNLYFAAAAPEGAGEETVGHVPFPDTVTPVEIAKAAGNLLAYNTIKQVNDSVGGTTDDAHDVYEAIKEDITPKITAWWNNLSSEDQQSYIDKVQTDEDLMVSELIPQDIITDIVSESVGYTGNFYDSFGDYYDYGQGNYDLPEMKFSLEQHNFIQASASNCSSSSLRSKVKLLNYHFYDRLTSKYINLVGWYFIKDDYNTHKFYVPLDFSEVITASSLVTKYDSVTSQYFVDNAIDTYAGNFVEPYEYIFNVVTTFYYVPTYVEIQGNYNPDDQQLEPFYYPVNNLKMADAWDTETITDTDFQNDALLYAAIEAPEYDVSCGASVATPLDYVGDQLVDSNTGLPLNLGSDTPWNTTNGQ